MWFDASAALTQIRCVKSSKAGQVNTELRLDLISTNSTISTVTLSKYENLHLQGNDKEKLYYTVKSVFQEYQVLDELEPRCVAVNIKNNVFANQTWTHAKQANRANRRTHFAREVPKTPSSQKIT